MQRIESISKNVRTLPQCATVHEAAQLMGSAHIGLVPIVDPQRRPVGVLTDRDIALRVVGEGIAPTALIRDVMTRGAHVVSEDQDVELALRLMNSANIQRLVVCDKTGRVAGVVGREAILAALERGIPATNHGSRSARARRGYSAAFACVG